MVDKPQIKMTGLNRENLLKTIYIKMGSKMTNGCGGFELYQMLSKNWNIGRYNLLWKTITWYDYGNRVLGRVQFFRCIVN